MNITRTEWYNKERNYSHRIERMEKMLNGISNRAAMNVQDVASCLKISRAKAYELVQSDGFPRIVIGRRIVIPTDAFENWLETNTITNC